MIHQYDLTWEDVAPIFAKLTPPELAKALEDPSAFFKGVATAGGPLGRRLLVAQLRPKIQPITQRIGLTWDDVLTALEMIDTVEELQAAFSDPEAFLEALVNAGGPAAKRMLLAKLRPRLQPIFSKEGLEWADALVAFELIDELSELHAAIANPAAFLERVIAGSGDVAKRMVLAKLRPKLEPIINKQGLQWADVRSAFEQIDSMSELQEALTAPGAFLERLVNGVGPAAKRMLLAKLRPKLEPIINKQGLQWPDVLSAFEQIDSISELQEALSSPADFLKQL